MGMYSTNLRTAWVGRDLKVKGCPWPHPNWPRSAPGMEHPQFLWANCAIVLPPSEQRTSS